MAAHNADRRSGGNGDEEPEETEQLPEGQQREHQPDRVKADGFADELRREHVALEELADPDNGEGKEEKLEARPSLNEGDAKRKHQRSHRSDIRHEAQEPAERPDQEAEIKAYQRQPDAVPQPQE